MKKRLLVLAFAVMALGLAGCGDKKEEAKTAPTTEEVAEASAEGATEATIEGTAEEVIERTTEEVDDTIEVKLTTSSASRPFAVAIYFPTKEAGDEVVADCETEVKNSSVIFKNDKITIEAKLGAFVYNSYADYKAKYGDKETNYINYVEYWEDPDFDSHKGTVMPVKTNIAGYEAVAFDFDSSMKYTLNNSDFYSDSQFDIVVTSNDKSVKISELLEDAEVKTIIDSIKISDYVTE